MAAPTNDIILSALGDSTVASRISALIVLSLFDRGGLIEHPAIVDLGDQTGSRSSVVKQPVEAFMGVAELADAADGEAPSPSITPWSQTSFSVTVATKRKNYMVSDLARTITAGQFDMDRFAEDAVASYQTKLIKMAAALLPSITASVGVTNTPMTLATFLAAKATLTIANASGALLAILSGKQWTQLEAELALSSGGSVQFDAATPEKTKLMGTGYKGQLFGVDVFVSNHVTIASGDYIGAMLGANALAKAWATISPLPGQPMAYTLADGLLLFEASKETTAGNTTISSSAILGMSIGINAAGVKIISED